MSDLDFRSAPASLVDLLARRAAERPDAKAFVFVPERGGAHVHLTFAELHRRARAVAARLAQRTVRGDRAVLLFPPGLDFIVAFFGCLAAGVIAVPLMVPRRTAARDSSAAIIADCSPKIAMTTGELLEARPDVAERFRDAGFDWLTVSAMEDAPDDPAAVLPVADRDDIAFLQYTSGSTSTPKGVMVTHDNLLANLEMIRTAMSNTEHSTSVGWVPLYHDMGLMMGVMQPLYLGAMSVLMAPAAFMQRPLNWLHTIHQYRAELTSAPNFAFDLCVSRFRADQMEGSRSVMLEARPERRGTGARRYDRALHRDLRARTASTPARCTPATDWRKPRCWSPAAFAAGDHPPAASAARHCNKAKPLKLPMPATRSHWCPADTVSPMSISPSSIPTCTAELRRAGSGKSG